MPVFWEQNLRLDINRSPRTGFDSGCFENRRSMPTGERVRTVIAEQLNNHKEREAVQNGYDKWDKCFLQVGQTVRVNLDGRHVSASVVRKLPYSHSVELCLLHNGSRVVVDQHQILQNTEKHRPERMSGSESVDSWNRPSPLVLDIPNYDDTNTECQGSDDTEEKMAAAVLTSLSLSPVLKSMHVEHDEMFEEAMLTEDVSDEAITTPGILDEESNKKDSKQRRRKNSSKTLFQCTWSRCGKMFTNASAIARHIRALHLEPKDEGYSDGEEEFYFIEIESENTTEPSSENSPSSTRPTSRRGRSFSDPSMPTQSPVSPSSLHLRIDDNFIWPLRTTGGRSKAKRPLHQTAHTLPRKARGDGKKCRKVFGMENKQLWCTQCRWKKACAKFID